MASKKILTIIIGFLHDFAAGCWAATVLTVYLLAGKSKQIPAAALTEIQQDFFYLGLLCITVVMVSGAGRSFTYVQHVYGPEAETMRKKMLIMKHIFLLAVFGLGTYWQYRLIIVPGPLVP